MNESKIVATKRLQSEGLWNEASLYREEVREHLRGEGMTRKEANRGAWEEMLEAYPPFDADDEAAHWLSACDFPPADVSTVEAWEPSLADLWYVLCVLSAYRAYETSSEGLQLVAYAHQQSSSAQVRSWLSLLVASAELFRGEVAEALSAKIARLESEDQQAVVTELRTHEQGLVGAGAIGVASMRSCL